MWQHHPYSCSHMIIWTTSSSSLNSHPANELHFHVKQNNDEGNLRKYCAVMLLFNCQGHSQGRNGRLNDYAEPLPILVAFVERRVAVDSAFVRCGSKLRTFWICNVGYRIVVTLDAERM